MSLAWGGGGKVEVKAGGKGMGRDVAPEHYFRRLGIRVGIEEILDEQPDPARRPLLQCWEGIAVIVALGAFYAFAIWAGTRLWKH